MAWANPRSWGLTENPLPVLLNQELRDNLLSLRALHDASIRVHRTAVQSLANNARTPIAWQAAAYQTGIAWSAATLPTQITVAVSGLYLLVTSLPFANVVGGQRGVGWRKNGEATAWDLQLQPGNGVDTVNGIELIDLAAGDFIEVYGYQTSGAALSTVSTGEGACWAALSLLATGPDSAPAWVPPRTWTNGDLLSPAMLNTQIRDQFLNIRNLKGVGAKVWLSADQSISSGERAALKWDRSIRNIGGFWTGDTAFVAPVDGVYLGLIDLEWAGAGLSGVMGTGYRINDKTNHDLQFQPGSGNGAVLSGGDLVQLAAGDTLEWFAFQDSAESMSVHGGSEDRTRASVTLWAAAS